MVHCRGMFAVVLLLVLVGAKENEEDCSLIQHSRKSSLEHEEKLKQEGRPASVPLLETAEKRDDGYHLELFVKAGPGVTITGPPFDRSSNEDAVYGCGSGNVKCSCAYTSDGFRMTGYGTQGTMTALDFTCHDVIYSMPGHRPDTCTCNYTAALSYWGGARRFPQECSPKQCYKFVDYPGAPGGHVQDLERFHHPNGGGNEEKSIDSSFSVQAEALGSVVPESPAAVLGGWKAVASGAGLSIKQSVTWSSTQTKASAKEVAEALITVGSKYSFSSKASVEVPLVSKGEVTQSVEVSLSDCTSTSWKNTITDTMASTNGGAQEVTCNPAPCPRGTSYQRQTSVEKLGKWGALFDSCFFVCMPNQGQHPKCPFGTCCTGKSTDQCSTCTVQWCSHSDPDCSFSDRSFKVTC
ncbi:unnamed protein product [Polarella glacialis]|uniref:Uncharacterized protein n=1 Tax=Polarella glacialis TaxID=89957 RepID=A0A813I7R7_POLGL|nr:unnamed protein product [Polarella glacialis]